MVGGQGTAVAQRCGAAGSGLVPGATACSLEDSVFFLAGRDGLRVFVTVELAFS